MNRMHCDTVRGALADQRTSAAADGHNSLRARVWGPVTGHGREPDQRLRRRSPDKGRRSGPAAKTVNTAGRRARAWSHSRECGPRSGPRGRRRSRSGAALAASPIAIGPSSARGRGDVSKWRSAEAAGAGERPLDGRGTSATAVSQRRGGRAHGARGDRNNRRRGPLATILTAWRLAAGRRRRPWRAGPRPQGCGPSAERRDTLSDLTRGAPTGPVAPCRRRCTSTVTLHFAYKHSTTSVLLHRLTFL